MKIAHVVATLAIAALLSAVAEPAFADQENLDRGIADAVSTYNKKGLDGLASRGELCYSSINYKRGNRDTIGQKTEFCFAYEMAATVITKQVTGAYVTSGYFLPTDVMTRGLLKAVQAGLVTGPDDQSEYMSPRIKYVMANTPKVTPKP